MQAATALAHLFSLADDLDHAIAERDVWLLSNVVERLRVDRNLDSPEMLQAEQAVGAATALRAATLAHNTGSFDIVDNVLQAAMECELTFSALVDPIGIPNDSVVVAWRIWKWCNFCVQHVDADKHVNSPCILCTTRRAFAMTILIPTHCVHGRGGLALGGIVITA